MAKAEKKRKVAWGITGSGDRLGETLNVMKEIKEHYKNEVEIRVYLSKAGEQVVRWYKLYDQLKQNFEKVWVEFNSNSPFLAGDLELRKYEFLLIAPSTSNTVAKIAAGISDTMLCNSAIMALKASVSVYIMPSDYKEGTVVTRLPNGKDFTLRVRREDAENTRKLASMDCVFVLEKPEDVNQVFMKHFGPRE
ncbi:MAG: archaeoflavoprotein AfpA [Candidatus Bathyarchaeia archaeon]